MNDGQYYERSWLDGCFDFMHFGHANAILQAKIASNNVSFSRYKFTSESKSIILKPCSNLEFFTPNSLASFRAENPECPLPRKGIWIGLHSDKEIEQHKGSLPVIALIERCYHVSFIRWVSERGVVKDVPYVTDLSQGVNDAKCEFVLHGDDLVCDANGIDCYYNVRKQNRFLIVKRTDGVSTTEIIQRILTGSYAERDNKTDFEDFFKNEKDFRLCERLAYDENGLFPYCWVFNQSMGEVVVAGGWSIEEQRDILFYNTSRTFDMFNAGDLEILNHIKKTYKSSKLIVGLGIGNESCVNNFRERLFSLVSCSLVDGVILNPTASNIDEHLFTQIITNDSELNLIDLKFKYLTADVIKQRIKNQRAVYEARNKKKLEN
ncbi:hypothetical protein QEN19_002195 [Hanseniaspora menglaensis]